MIAVDTNVLICADRTETPLHHLAFKALRRLAEGHEAWGLPVFCVGEFLRVISHARVFNPPTPIADAISSLDSLLASPSIRLLSPGEQYIPLLSRTLECSGATGNLVFDAQIAAVCLEHGATTLLTEDRDFARFADLTIIRLVDFVG